VVLTILWHPFPLPCPDIPPQRDPGDTECLADLTDAIVLVGFLLRDVGDLDEEAVKREMRRYPRDRKAPMVLSLDGPVFTWG
jgi:hypothetical protein